MPVENLVIDVRTNAGNSARQLRSLRNALRGVSNTATSVSSAAKKASNAISKFFNSIKRIAFYRAIRAIIKAITEAFSVGLENAVKFSRGITTESHRFAQALDSIATKSLTMKNQLGSAFIGLLTALTPAINKIIELVTRAADAISQFFAAFTGKKYLKAREVPQIWTNDANAAAKATKAWKNQLLSFDEINRLEEPNNGGGSGKINEVDPSLMFEDADIKSPVYNFANNLKQAILSSDWEGVGRMLGDALNSVLPEVGQFRAWGEKIGKGFTGMINTVYWTLKQIDFRALGERLTNFINGAIRSIDFKMLGRLLAESVTIIIDFLVAAFRTLDWGRITEALGEMLVGILDESTEWIGTYDWDSVGYSFWENLKVTLEGIDFEAIAHSFFSFLGSAFGALGSLLAGFFGGVVQDIKDYFAQKMEECGGDAWEGFKKGIVDAVKGIWVWIKTHILEPFVTGFKNAFGIASPSEEMEPYGKFVWEGVLEGIRNAILGIGTWVRYHIWEPFKNGIKAIFGVGEANANMDDFGRNIVEGLKNGIVNGLVGIGTWVADTIWAPISQGLTDIWNQITIWASSLNTWTVNHIGFSMFDGEMPSDSSGHRGLISSIPGGADGGFVQGDGQLFVAREAGPELVGTIGGQTAIANNDQIVEGIRAGVYEAVSAAMSNGGNGDVNLKIYLDSREIKAGFQRLDRAWGA